MEGDEHYDHFMLDANNYKKIKLLGNGRFGDLSLVEDISGKRYAMREVFQDDTATAGNKNPQKVFMVEIQFFQIVRHHPAIAKFIGFYLGPNSIVMEYCPNGSLQKMLESDRAKKAPPQWNNTTKAKAIFGFACAMHHLHNLGIIHRYLTPSNILFDENYEIRLCDFGFAKIPFDETKKSVINSKPTYTAPEAISQEYYDLKVDVYSFAIIAYEILTGLEPFDPKLNYMALSNEIIKTKARPAIPKGLDPVMVKVLEDSWNDVAVDRPSFIDILRAMYVMPTCILPDVDMADFQNYQETLISDTNMTEEDLVYLNAPVATEESTAQFNECLIKAEEGDADACVELSRMYRIGYGTNPDVERAFFFSNEAAKKGHVAGLYTTALFLENGKGTKIDRESSTKMMKKAADMHFPLAIIDYARRLEKGIGIEANINEALRILKELADPPHSLKEAMYEYGRLLYKGTDEIAPNPAEGVKYLIRSSDEGYIPANMDYAKALIDGIGVPKNVEEGMKIYKQGVTQNIPVAINNIAYFYDKGLYGLKKDEKKAIELYEKAAKKGYPDSMVKYGNYLHKNGDKVAAAEYFKKAAKKGNSLGCHNYASYLEKGLIESNDGINMDKAVKYYIRANTKASYLSLADIYFNGFGTILRDMNKTKFYLEKAIDLGSADAAVKLAEIKASK